MGLFIFSVVNGGAKAVRIGATKVSISHAENLSGLIIEASSSHWTCSDVTPVKASITVTHSDVLFNLSIEGQFPGTFSARVLDLKSNLFKGCKEQGNVVILRKVFSPSSPINRDDGRPIRIKVSINGGLVQNTILNPEFHYKGVPSPSWNKSQVHIRLRVWADVLLTNMFVEIEAKEQLPIIVGYMIYHIKTNTLLNFAYFVAKPMNGLDLNNDAIPYAWLMTIFFENIKNQHPNDESGMIKVDGVYPRHSPFNMECLKA
ncbi:hypothetical protein Tco_1011763 [Tanacetum coccineum]